MNPWRGLRGLPRPMWLFAFAMLVNRAGSMVLPFLVLYLTRSLGFSPGLAGFIFAAYGGGALVASPISGKLCDRFGARRVIVLSLGSSGLVLLAFPLATTPITVSFAALCLALATEAFRPASFVLMTELVPREQRKQSVALFRLAVNLGMSIGPALGGVLASLWFPALFLIDGATSILATVLLAAVFGPFGAPPAANLDDVATPAPAVISSVPAHRNPAFLFFLAAALFVAIVFFQNDAAFPLYVVRHLGISERGYGLLFPVNTVLILAVEVPLSSATAAWPHRRSLVVGSLLCGLGLGALVFVQTLPAVMVTVVVWTFGEMILFPALPAYVADLAPPGRSGEYMGLYATAFGLAFAVGPGLGSEVLERFGGDVLWPGVFALSVVAAFMMSRLRDIPKVEAPAA